MDCIVCQHRSGYNRVVVDVDSGYELGGLCVDCETAKLGELSDELGAPGDDTCIFCDRDAFWTAPKWLPSTYETSDGTVSYVDYDASTAALKFCDEHLSRLGVEDISTPATTPDEAEHITYSTED